MDQVDEQQDRIDALEAENGRLEDRVRELESEMRVLENKVDIARRWFDEIAGDCAAMVKEMKQ